MKSFIIEGDGVQNTILKAWTQAQKPSVFMVKIIEEGNNTGWYWNRSVCKIVFSYEFNEQQIEKKGRSNNDTRDQYVRPLRDNFSSTHEKNDKNKYNNHKKSGGGHYEENNKSYDKYSRQAFNNTQQTNISQPNHEKGFSLDKRKPTLHKTGGFGHDDQKKFVQQIPDDIKPKENIARKSTHENKKSYEDRKTYEDKPTYENNKKTYEEKKPYEQKKSSYAQQKQHNPEQEIAAQHQPQVDAIKSLQQQSMQQVDVQQTRNTVPVEAINKWLEENAQNIVNLFLEISKSFSLNQQCQKHEIKNGTLILYVVSDPEHTAQKKYIFSSIVILLYKLLRKKNNTFDARQHKIVIESC